MGYIEAGKKWYAEHTEHVDKLKESTKLSFRPSLEDLNHPELWKAASWNWFFEEQEREENDIH